MWSKKALVVALAMAASPQADAFSHPNAAVVRLRASGSAVCPAVSRTATLGPQMKGGAANDMGDLTIEMLKRIERNLGELDDMQLAQLQGICQQIADKAHKARGPGAVGPPTKIDYNTKSFAEIEAENDAFFGLDQSDEEVLEELPPPRRARPPAAAAAPAAVQPPAPAPAPEPAPVARTPEPAPPVPETPKPSRVQNADNQFKAYEAVEGGRKFSKYIPPVAETKIDKKATVESFVSEDEWTQAYIKEFGAPPPEVPLVDDETPRPAGGAEDSFAEVRKIQASAGDYPTPEAYYDALNGAIARWRNRRQDGGGLVGAVVSDRYMDQLASMRPFDEPEGGKKFSLGCMLVERKGTDSDGNERGILVTTSVDPPGTLGIAGVQKGDAVLALNGSDVENYQDLKREMGKIHAAGRMTVDITIQRQAVGVPEILTVSS